MATYMPGTTNWMERLEAVETTWKPAGLTCISKVAGSEMELLEPVDEKERWWLKKHNGAKPYVVNLSEDFFVTLTPYGASGRSFELVATEGR